MSVSAQVSDCCARQLARLRDRVAAEAEGRRGARKGIDGGVNLCQTYIDLDHRVFAFIGITTSSAIVPIPAVGAYNVLTPVRS